VTSEAHPAIPNNEFSGEILPMAGPPIRLREDLAMEPGGAYVWQGVEGADEDHFGKVIVRRKLVTRHSSLVTDDGGSAAIAPGETCIIDFGQNCAAVPEFVFSADRGVTLTARPAEMLNDGNGDKARHCDGPGGSAYFAEYRKARTRAQYTFAGTAEERYHPSFTFFGGRYLSVTADGPVEIRRVRWIPVSSIVAEAETGFLETGDASLNRFIQNVLWGQRSNYLSIPTDCPQRAERLGWTADTQIFAKAACYNADVRDFLRKWMRDMRDSQRPDGGFPGVAPVGMIGANEHQFGWADAGIIVPYTLWRHYGDTEIVRENWEAMERYVALVEKMKFDSPQAREHQWADWLSLEKLETASGRAYVSGIKNVPPVKEDALVLWRYFGACYWLQDALMMAEMAPCAEGARGVRGESPRRSYRDMASQARSYIRDNFIDPSDGMLIPLFRDMQTPALFALKLGILDEGPARATRDALLANIRDHGSCLQTGFLGTAMILDVLTDQCDAIDVAYTLLLQHGFPSWLYSVDQGATTVWESWDAYTVAHGFSPGLRSFNHYAYGAIVAWMYRTMAGIREDPTEGGFRHFVLAPRPDPRMGHCTARYRSPSGEIESSWRYAADGKWTWRFTIPAGTTATVVVPGELPVDYPAGRHDLVCKA
jgi:alpha-L-rhamnosidase